MEIERVSIEHCGVNGEEIVISQDAEFLHSPNHEHFEEG